jgi:hypothetical protein
MGVQTERPDYYISAVGDRVIHARKYISSDQLMKRRLAAVIHQNELLHICRRQLNPFNPFGCPISGYHITKVLEKIPRNKREAFSAGWISNAS